jgi:hypothetical protein
MTVVCRLPGTCGCDFGPVYPGGDYQAASERGVPGVHELGGHCRAEPAW